MALFLYHSLTSCPLTYLHRVLQSLSINQTPFKVGMNKMILKKIFALHTDEKKLQSFPSCIIDNFWVLQQ